MKDLATLGGQRSTAYGINDSAQVVGRSDTTNQASAHAFLYPDPANASQMKDLGTAAPGGAQGFTPVSVAFSINGSGQIAATSDAVNTLPRVTHAFLYTISNGTWKDLESLYIAASSDQGTRSSLFSDARGINSLGQVVGFSRRPSNVPGGATQHAFLYSDPNCPPPSPPPSGIIPNPCMQDLGTINYAPTLDCDPFVTNLICESFAYGINDSGKVVGESEIASPNCNCPNAGRSHAFLYPDANSPSQMKDLGTLGGGSTSKAYGINNSGQVVGFSTISSGEKRAFIWQDDGDANTSDMKDLNTLIPENPGWTLREARAINNNGQIAAVGEGSGTQALLLTPKDPNAPPATPSTPDLDTASDSGNSSTDNITNDDTPTFTGTADEGSTVKIYVDGVEKGSGVATGGNYSVTTTPLAQGNRSITAKASNGSAESGESQALSITVDKTAPDPGSFSLIPSDGQTGVSPTSNITVTFPEKMDESTLNNNTVKLVKPGRKPTSIPLTMTKSTDGSGRTVLTLDPYGSAKQKLAGNTTYQLTIEGASSTNGLAVKDLAGNELAQDKVSSFTTARK